MHADMAAHGVHGVQSELGEAQDPSGGKGGKGESPLQQALAAIQQVLCHTLSTLGMLLYTALIRQADTTLSKGSSTMNTEHEVSWDCGCFTS